MCDCITHLYLGRIFNTRDNISHVPCTENIPWLTFDLQYPYLIRVIFASCVDKLHHLMRMDGPVGNLEICYYAPERVKNRIENQGLQRCIRISLRRRYPENN